MESTTTEQCRECDRIDGSHFDGVERSERGAELLPKA